MLCSAAPRPGKGSSESFSRSPRATRAPGSTRPTTASPRATGSRTDERRIVPVRARLRSMFGGDAMPWLADTDVGAAYGFARGIVEARTEAELRGRVLEALAGLVPADVLTWDRVELATGAVGHEAVPAQAEPPGAFDAVVERAADHPLLAAHAAP